MIRTAANPADNSLSGRLTSRTTRRAAAWRRAAIALAASLQLAVANADPAAPTPAVAPAITLDPSIPAVAGYERAGALRRQFDKNRAFGLLEEQVAMGPRIPESEGSKKFVAWASSHFTQAGWTVEAQAVDGTDSLARRTVPGVNVIAYPKTESNSYILLTCHWDTRRFADKDPRPARRTEPVPGANDGASGVAVLLEIARVMGSAAPLADVGVIIVLFDLEDQGVAGEGETFCMGSKRFAQQFDTMRWPVRAAINIDMIGDKDLRLKPEAYSLQQAPDVVASVWSHGMMNFPKVFISASQQGVFDDHVRLAQAGIPAINLIDLEYSRWHTVDDLPAACSPDSLHAVGSTLLSYLGHGTEPLH